jgi:hypothetical protein
MTKGKTVHVAFEEITSTAREGKPNLSTTTNFVTEKAIV